jgi:putative oxidoreductase
MPWRVRHGSVRTDLSTPIAPRNCNFNQRMPWAVKARAGHASGFMKQRQLTRWMDLDCYLLCNSALLFLVFIFFSVMNKLESPTWLFASQKDWRYVMNQNRFSNLGALGGRILLGLMFVSAGLQKIGAYAGTQGYMESMGVPGGLLPLVIALEIGAGLAVILGLATRVSALALAGFTLSAAVLFHANLADQMQSILFMKNVAIAGGFFLLAVGGPGAWSLDRAFVSRLRPVMSR